jgi:hypothetical protein
MQRLCRILLHFLFRFKIDGAIFYAMVGFIAMVHAVWRFHCVLASIVPQPRFEVLPLWLYWGIFDRKSLGFFPTKAL